MHPDDYVFTGQGPIRLKSRRPKTDSIPITFLFHRTLTTLPDTPDPSCPSPCPSTASTRLRNTRRHNSMTQTADAVPQVSPSTGRRQRDNLGLFMLGKYCLFDNSFFTRMGPPPRPRTGWPQEQAPCSHFSCFFN